jgi:hypothetical protein
VRTYLNAALSDVDLGFLTLILGCACCVAVLAIINAVVPAARPILVVRPTALELADATYPDRGA